MEAIRIEERIIVDGRLDEEVWQRAEPAGDFYQQEPDEGELSVFATEVRFLYDDTTLYVGAMMYDDRPDALIVNELTRDFVGSNSDTFGLVLDLFRDGQTGFGFLTNAGGATRDGYFRIYRKLAGFSPNHLYYPSYFDGLRALHGWTEVPTYNASHGCVRIPYWNAQWVYGLADYGTRVVIYHS